MAGADFRHHFTFGRESEEFVRRVHPILQAWVGHPTNSGTGPKFHVHLKNMPLDMLVLASADPLSRAQQRPVGRRLSLER
jgi:hypothetical protein